MPKGNVRVHMGRGEGEGLFSWTSQGRTFTVIGQVTILFDLSNAEVREARQLAGNGPSFQHPGTGLTFTFSGVGPNRIMVDMTAEQAEKTCQTTNPFEVVDVVEQRLKALLAS